MPTPFRDISFPNAVARGATGGPGFSTEVVPLASGREERNQNWSGARGQWNISTGILSRDEMALVIAHFRVVKGRAYSFRFRDWNDFQGVDQAMTQLTPTTYQIVKRYSVLGFEDVRNITKPVSGSVIVKVAGSTVVPADINHLTGVVTFAAPPASAPTASFDYDVPVRFGSDRMDVQANHYNAQVVPTIELVEVLE
jgi:uncharacterized protein (TIGR02217 family)